MEGMARHRDVRWVQGPRREFDGSGQLSGPQKRKRKRTGKKRCFVLQPEVKELVYSGLTLVVYKNARLLGLAAKLLIRQLL